MAIRQVKREQTKAYLKELRELDKNTYGGFCWRIIKKNRVRGLNDRVDAMLSIAEWLKEQAAKKEAHEQTDKN